MTYTNTFESIDPQGQISKAPISQTVFVEDGKLQLRNTGSTSSRTLFEEMGIVTSYALSPDGETVVFSTSGQYLWIAEIADSKPQSLGKGLDPDWDPTGTWFTYMLTEDDGHSMLNSEIYIMASDGSQKINVTNTSQQVEMHPRWSPDGSWIVYDTESQGQLFIQQLEWR